MDIKTLKEQIFQLWNQRQNSHQALATIDAQIENVKLDLSKLSFQPNGIDPSVLDHVRDLLELGAFFSIETQRIDAFERYLAQLKVHYFDYQEVLSESSNKYVLLGLNLLRLLSQNRLAEFHTELELLPSDIIQSNVFINSPVMLEQYLMEGSYNKVFLAKNQIPTPYDKYYKLFIDVLLNTIRIEIASCLETAFDSVKFADAARLLFLSNADELKKFCGNSNWIISADGKTISFSKNQDLSLLTAKVASRQIASQIIEYAIELEKIV